MMNLLQHHNNLYLNKNFLIIFCQNLLIPRLDIFPEIVFQNLYSSLIVTFRNLHL